jgi:hypothetical protein
MREVKLGSDKHTSKFRNFAAGLYRRLTNALHTSTAPFGFIVGAGRTRDVIPFSVMLFWMPMPRARLAMGIFDDAPRIAMSAVGEDDPAPPSRDACCSTE